MNSDAAIWIKDLRKSFDDETFVLKGIDLEIPKGQITVIIGFSGTGKSVLMKHMLGLLAPTSGQVYVLGRNLWEMSDVERIEMRCHMGVLFQHAALFDDMTVLENVMFPLKEHRRYWPEERHRSTAMQKLKLSGLDEVHFRKLPEELSGGMRKRVGLARALALDPEILFYDEPTTGLDPILTEMVDNLILETHRQHPGGTSVVISHDLMAAFRIADKVVMLDKGRVLLQGQPVEFMNSKVELVQRFVAKGMKTS